MLGNAKIEYRLEVFDWLTGTNVWSLYTCGPGHNRQSVLSAAMFVSECCPRVKKRMVAILPSGKRVIVRSMA